MTYEKFCQRVLEEGGKDSKLTRKTIRNTAIRLMLIFAEVSVALGYLVSCVLQPVAVITGIVTFMALTYVVFEYISEDNKIYTKWNTVSKFWWLGFILMVVAIVAMRLNFK